MPVLLKGDSNMAVMPMSYSPGAVARKFQVVREFDVAGRKMQVIYDEATPRASIINADIENIDGASRHRVYAMLEIERKKDIGDNVLAVERFWQDNVTVMQIEGVCVNANLREGGLATLLYETLVNECGVILMSDNEQYEGGKALWKKIASQSSLVKVFVLDTDEGKFYPYDGERVCYDGKTIPEGKIWSKHPDREMWGVVLVAESAQRVAELAV